jgi:hypothetical protein
MVMSTPQIADKLARHFLRSTPDWRSEATSIDIAMTAGLDSARFGGADWKPNLEVVQECYARGCCYATRGFDHYERGSEIEADLAAQIMATPDRFPEYLVWVAERRCRQNLAISPVANIAIQEKWFEG